MEAIILGNPYDIIQGSITPITVPAYEAEQAVVQLSDGFNPYTIGGSSTSTSDTYWFRYSTGLLRPLISTDAIVIGGTSLIGTEKFRVIGKINSTSLQLGSTVTISSILDEDDMVSNSATAVPTQQSVKAYVDGKSGDYLSAGDNISLLTNNSGYIITETDPIFTSSAAYSITSTLVSHWTTAYGWGNHATAGYITTELDPVFTASVSYSITSTQVSHWDTAYSWGNHALVGYITTETDPIFIASAAHTVTSGLITNWNLAYTNNHTHSNKEILDIIIGSGSGTQALFNDGTYKTVLTSVGGSDTQIIYNSSGAYVGSSFMTFDGSLTYIDTLRISSTLQIGDSTTNIHKGGDGDLTFYDSVVAIPYTLAELVGTATNFWTPNGSNIWYGYKVGIGGISTFTESLEVTGNILADNFNSKYFRFNSNGNLLLGPSAGDQETGVNKLYIHNNNSTTPLIYGNFTTLDLTFAGNVTIPNAKAIIFGTSTTEIYSTDNGSGLELYFKDTVANSGSALTLSDLRSGTYYSLISAFTDHAAVVTITSAYKTIWNKASYITITGDGTKYLSDNGVYNTVSSSITVTDNILKWDTSTFRPYSTKSEAGGSSSIGKLFRGTTGPDATYRLNYDGYFYSTSLYVSGTGSLTWQNSANADAYALYCGGVTGSNNILVLRNFASGDEATILDIMSYTTDLTTQREATISFVRGDDTNTELMDIYNNGYTVDTSYGIRLSKSGTGSWRNFNFDYYDTSSRTKTVVYQITPTPTFDFKIEPTVNGTNLEHTLGNPSVNGYILSSTTAGVRSWVAQSEEVTPVSDILYWNSSTSKYTPYTTSTSGCFDSSTTNPTGTTRLNYDGLFYATRISCYGDNTSGTKTMYLGYTYSTNDVLQIESNYGTGINVNSAKGKSIIASSVRDNVLSISQASDSNNTTDVIYINRTGEGSVNITGNLLNILDNPATSGTISGSILKATIGSTVRIDMNPRVVDSSSAIAYILDTNNALSTTGAKIVSIRNNGTEKVSIDKDGSVTSISLSGTSDRMVAVDSTGKLKILNTAIDQLILATQIFS